MNSAEAIDSVSRLRPTSDLVTRGAGAPTVQRFTLDGDAALEQHLARACERVLSGVRGLIPAAKLEAVFLGGGYGRGEGGVLRTASGDQPYNDLEFYIAVRGNRHLNELRYRRAVEVLGEILTQLAGLEIEFKITSLAEVERQPVSMFSYDLLCGHRVLSRDGSPPAVPPDWALRHRDATAIPTMEATRLLMNRGTGLLLAGRKLAAETLAPADADFIRRNIAKAQLACGDAVLASRGRYNWSCRERHRRSSSSRRSIRRPGTIRSCGIMPTAWRSSFIRTRIQFPNTTSRGATRRSPSWRGSAGCGAKGGGSTASSRRCEHMRCIAVTSAASCSACAICCSTCDSTAFVRRAGPGGIRGSGYFTRWRCCCGIPRR